MSNLFAIHLPDEITYNVACTFKSFPSTHDIIGCNPDDRCAMQACDVALDRGHGLTDILHDANIGAASDNPHICELRNLRMWEYVCDEELRETKLDEGSVTLRRPFLMTSSRSLGS